jgi:hypothetical protein
MCDVPVHPAVSLLLQAEGDYHFAVRHKDFALPDPPVRGYHLAHGDQYVFTQDGQNPIADSVTAFVLQYVTTWTRGEGGGFGTGVAQATDLRRDLRAAFPTQCRFGQRDLFEADNILVWLVGSDRPSWVVMRVEVAKPIPREAIPAFLWECARGASSHHGMFIP